MPLTPEQTAEIDALRAAAAKPPCAPPRTGWRRISTPRYPVLDHGFVRVIDYMGDDAAICQAARVSLRQGHEIGVRTTRG